MPSTDNGSLEFGVRPPRQQAVKLATLLSLMSEFRVWQSCESRFSSDPGKFKD